MKPKVQPLGAAITRERQDGGRVKLSTFIPLKIRKRGGCKVVVRPDGQLDAPGKVASQIDQPLLVALTRAFYWQQLLDDGVVGSGSTTWGSVRSARICCIRSHTDCTMCGADSAATICCVTNSSIGTAGNGPC